MSKILEALLIYTRKYKSVYTWAGTCNSASSSVTANMLRRFLHIGMFTNCFCFHFVVIIPCAKILHCDWFVAILHKWCWMLWRQWSNIKVMLDHWCHSTQHQIQYWHAISCSHLSKQWFLLCKQSLEKNHKKWLTKTLLIMRGLWSN